MQDVKLFYPNDPKYKCCCGGHVTTGAKIIASINIIFIVLETFSTISSFGVTDAYEAWGHLLICLFGFVVNGLLWHGLVHEREDYLIPYMVLQVLYIIVYVVLVILLLTMGPYILVHVAYYGGSRVSQIQAAVVMLLGLIALQCWFFAILKSAYDYIKQKRCQSISDVAQRMDQVPVTVTNEGSLPPAYSEVPLYAMTAGKFVPA